MYRFNIIWVVQVATAVRADWLFLLTDVDALYTSNPRVSPDAQPIHTVHDMGQLQVGCRYILLCPSKTVSNIPCLFC